MRCVALAFLFAAGACSASPVYTVAEPWLRPAKAGAGTELYLELRASEPAELIAVSTTAAARSELVDRHGKPVPAIALAPGVVVRLAAGAPRVQLSGLAQRIARGGHVPLTLTVRGADGSVQEIPVEAEVRLHSPSHDHGVR
ncbi:MAG: copper chaperone PCu(A)C [Burkholderiales bacterium]